MVTIGPPGLPEKNPQSLPDVHGLFGVPRSALCRPGLPLLQQRYSRLQRSGRVSLPFQVARGPEDMAARDGLLYLADNFHALIHVFTYEGKLLRSLDVLLKNRIKGVIDPEIDMFQQQWNTDGLLHVEDEDRFSLRHRRRQAGSRAGEGLIEFWTRRKSPFDIQPPAPDFIPKAWSAMRRKIFCLLYRRLLLNKPRGLYRYGANGRNKGPVWRGS